ncbi:MAG: dTDP-4-keto-6-deoxy-D-glucose epimerase, partial [Anaerolineae bacterium]
MAQIQESPVIKGLAIVQLKVFEDPRGRFMETFRKEWFPQRSWDIIQNNRSDSQKG